MTLDSEKRISIAVIIPAYKVSKQIKQLVQSIGSEVSHIIIVDDKCPENSGELVLKGVVDSRVEVLFNQKNMGVGGAVIAGYRRAMELEAEIVVKIDGDGQMDPALIPRIVEPLILGTFGYSKGNRFTSVDAISSMPKMRIVGNLLLSFMTKVSTGYWKMFDPNNGFTAIKTSVLSTIPLSKIDSRYFFESDMLFRLGLERIPICDVPMNSIYGDEKSNLIIRKIFFDFLIKHFRNTIKRIVYSYYLRDFTLASIELPLALILFLFGTVEGGMAWFHSASSHLPTPAGTIILSALSLIVGMQMLLSFLDFDVSNSP